MRTVQYRILLAPYIFLRSTLLLITGFLCQPAFCAWWLEKRQGKGILALRVAGFSRTKTATVLSCLAAVLSISFYFQTAIAAQQVEIKIGYLYAPPSKIAISLIDIPAVNEGLAGAELAVEDNTTTGQFLGQQFTLVKRELRPDDDPTEAVHSLYAQGVALVVTSIGSDDLLAAADTARSLGVLLFNASAQDDALRENQCRANVIHVAPSRSMLSDALAQYLVWKRWRRWALVVGSHEVDKLFGDALKRSAAKFGAKIIGERQYEDTGGARRTDNGLSEVQRQMPTLTQGLGDYDVLVAADESEVFAGYLPFRTWDPRPVVGSAGLVPTTWSASFDQWGAVQLQNRFTKMFHRPMKPLDAQVWTAVRMIGEAASRIGTADTAGLVAYIKGPDFSVAAFKGQKLAIRDWNLQLRQPILLSDGRNIVSVSPQEGFLHPESSLDTLGADKPETKCKLN
jgi:ABC transporter substrate binding protein (PQQ-dependent alcohol dehydrogenase system)